MKTLRIYSALLLVLVLSVLTGARPAAAAPRRQSYPTEILFQGFTWDAAVNGQSCLK